MYGDGDNLEVHLYNNIISGGIYQDGIVNSDYNLWRQAPPEQYNDGSNSIVTGNFDDLFVDRLTYFIYLIY